MLRWIGTPLISAVLLGLPLLGLPAHADEAAEADGSAEVEAPRAPADLPSVEGTVESIQMYSRIVWVSGEVVTVPKGVAGLETLRVGDQVFIDYEQVGMGLVARKIRVVR
jgi:hypothetical protein